MNSSLSFMDSLSELSISEESLWVSVCKVKDLTDGIGVCALVDGQQIAIFRLPSKSDADEIRLYALANYDPHGKAHVLSRGIVGDYDGQPFVASPLYKKRYNLNTGKSLDGDHFMVPVYAVKVYGESVFVGPIIA